MPSGVWFCLFHTVCVDAVMISSTIRRDQSTGGAEHGGSVVRVKGRYPMLPKNAHNLGLMCIASSLEG